MDWMWLGRELVLAIHEEQIAEHGGGVGVRDEGLLEFALARPLNAFSYGAQDVADLAASYGFGIARNHPFTDGNKRTAAVCMELFLDLHGHELTVSDEQMVGVIMELAAGDLTEEDLAAWIRANINPPA
ncbi:type II toxin-antitoxin system death-on-curing family toxin [Caenispirillum salinarum]|uniref:type II toxin-antitoxin system death-on-curing family toxin n=1 Tax=Caenispirillum salinarum TaxID=859058 RepID=UPI003850BFF4